MHPLGAAVIGGGFIGPVHAEGLRRLGIRVVGVLDISEGKSRQAAERMGVAKAYSNLEELLADEQVKVVHITTPNYLHFHQASEALKAGKHVLCDKPLAMNSVESAELVKLARQKRLAAGVNYNIRFYPLCLEARDMVRRGHLGDLYSVCGSYVQDWLLRPTDYNWRVLAEQGGELRAVADIGTHWLDLAQAITGRKVTSLCADLKTVHPVRLRPKDEVETFTGRDQEDIQRVSTEVKTEDQGCVLLRFEGGAQGCLWVSQVTAGRKNCLRIEIAGSISALAWCSEEPNELWIGQRDRANESLTRDPTLLSKSAAAFTNYPGGHNEGFPDTFKQCFRAFYDYIEEGNFTAPEPFATFADGHREILLCEAILKSHHEGRWVEIEG
jgi:predicted dehydrogenase